VRAWTLGSGSRGNSILLESAGTRVLIDAGYPRRVLARRLAMLQVSPESIAAIIVTHEHSDHARGVAAAGEKWRWHVYGSAGTLAGIAGLDARAATAVEAGAPFTVGELAFELVRVPHDAAAPTAVLATARKSGFRTGCAHDLGSVSEALRRAFTQLDLLLLESNHDEGMLSRGPYPPFVQQRIASRTGHLSNRQAAAVARELAGNSLRQVVLLHLSEVNNTPRAAATAVSATVASLRTRCRVDTATQDSVGGPFGDVGGGSLQLPLAL
jgi:phosphoribosyl 1,2-cyclic phosphodiesterase